MPVTGHRPGGARILLMFGVVGTLIVGVLVVAFLSRRGPEEPAAADSAEPIFVPGPTTFAPGLHLLGALSPSVAYAIETSDGVILIDAGLESSHTLLLQQLETLGIDINDLKIILITHGHGDHYLGVMNLKRLTGAVVYAGHGDSNVLRDAGPREAVFSTFPMDHVEIHPTAVDVELRGGETIELGETRIQAIATPGHTPGSMCYLMERGGETALFSGDTIMTFTGDLGTYSAYLPPRYRGDAEKYLATLRQLEKLSVPDLLLPGHPRTDQGINARITPEDWTSLLNRGIRQMEELTDHYAADGADFLDGAAKELLPGLHYLGDFNKTAVYCFSQESSIMLVNSAGGTELLSFLERQLGDIGLDLSMLEAVVLTRINRESTEGLGELIERTGCRVITMPADWESIGISIPDALLISPDDVREQYAWFQLEGIPIEGFGRPTLVYQIDWSGEQILMSGRVPAKIRRDDLPDLTPLDRPKALQSVSRLKPLAPNLWLPARPVHGQNANLYGADWQNILRDLRLSLRLGF